MEVVVAVGLVLLVAAVVFAFVALANMLYVASDLSCGYRPWRAPERQVTLNDSDLVDPDRIHCRVVVGWPVKGGLAPAVLTIDQERAHVRGGGALANIDRRLTRSIRTFRRSALGAGFVFDCADRRYGGLVVFPDDLASAIGVLEGRGWTVEGPRPVSSRTGSP